MEKRQTNLLAITIVAVVLAAGGGFYGGMKYAASKAQAQFTQGGRGAFGGGANGGGRGPGQGGFGGQRPQGGGPNGGNGDFVAGQITAKDDTSITLKTRDGSSKIVFFSGSTAIDKSVSGATSDLSVGEQVTASGKNNPDGSLAAQNIQIRGEQQNKQ